MSKVSFVGLDIAKNVFQVFLADEKGQELANRKMKRAAVINFFANLPPCTVGLEACGTAHYWARKLESQGHKARLIQPIRVKAFLGHRNKTDAADARAICEALMHPGTRFVSVKTIEQQDMTHLLCRRERLVSNRNKLVNQTRAFLAERGIIIPQGRWKFEKAIPAICAEFWEDFSSDFQAVLTENFAEYQELCEKIETIDNILKSRAVQSQDCQRLMTIGGVGHLTSSALISHVGDGKQFKNGRQMAAYFGITPKEYSSGGKQKLLGISKRGNKRVRTLLILAARAVITGIDRRKKDIDGTPLRLSNLEKWVLSIRTKSGTFKAIVALANKIARIAWIVLAKGEAFNPAKAAQCKV